MTERIYVDSPTDWVREQVAAIEAAGDTTAVSPGGRALVVLHIKGRRSGRWRKVPLMRVEHEGEYAAVASRGGAPTHPQWYHSLRANPDIELQDGTTTVPMRARQVSGAERQAWWQRCVEAYPLYAEYAVKAAEAGRQIPVLVLESRGG